jgi:hypothetical protein
MGLLHLPGKGTTHPHQVQVNALMKLEPPPLPILDNIFSLPLGGTPEFQHWLNHKDTYGPIGRVRFLR